MLSVCEVHVNTTQRDGIITLIWNRKTLLGDDFVASGRVLVHNYAISL